MAKNKTDQQKGVIALALLALVFASMGLFARYLSTDLSLFQQVYLRVLAAFFLGLIFFKKDLDFKKLKKISPNEWLVLLFRSVMGYLLGVTLFTQAITLTKYGNVSFIASLPMVALLGVIILKEKLTFQKVLLIILAFFGVMLIAVENYSNLLFWGRGEILAVLATLAFSLSYIARKWHSQLLNNKEITEIILFLAFLLVFLSSLIKGDNLSVVNWRASLLLVILVAGLFNVLNLFLTNYGFQKVKAVLASNILTLESVFAVFLGLIFYREIPMAREIVGGVIIVLSVIGINRQKERML